MNVERTDERKKISYNRTNACILLNLMGKKEAWKSKRNKKNNNTAAWTEYNKTTTIVVINQQSNWNRIHCCDDTIYNVSRNKKPNSTAHRHRALLFPERVLRLPNCNLRLNTTIQRTYNMSRVYEAFCFLFFFFFFLFAIRCLCVFIFCLFDPFVHSTINTISLFSRYTYGLCRASLAHTPCYLCCSHTCDNLEPIHVTLPFIFVDRLRCRLGKVIARIVV